MPIAARNIAELRLMLDTRSGPLAAGRAFGLDRGSPIQPGAQGVVAAINCRVGGLVVRCGKRPYMADADEGPSMRDRSSNDSPYDALPTAAPMTAIAATAAQLALHAGWTMALLYGKIEPIPTGEVPRLPTANELSEADRRKLESGRLEHLLRRLAALPEFAGSSLPTKVPAPDGNEAAWESALRMLNLDILCALTATRQETQLAYEVGRSLRDTANPPDQHPPTLALSRVFARDRIATLQGWLAALSSEFPPQAAAVVAASLGRWSEFATITAGTSSARLKSGDRTLAETMYKYLLRQGDLWLMLLVVAGSTAGFRSSQEILGRVHRSDGFKLAGEAEQEAMVEAITMVPSVRLPARAVRYLRKAGIGPTASLGKVRT